VARAAAFVLLAALAATVSASRAAQAASCARYASSSGRDAASGSAAHPFRTAQRLVRSLPAGATGCLAGGSTFFGRVVLDRPLTLRGLGARRPAIVGGLTLTPRARGAVVENVAVRGRGRGRAAILVNADRARILDNAISGTGYLDRNTACILLAGPRAVVITGNRVETCSRATRHGLAAPGIFVGSALGARVTDNVVVHTPGVGILLGPNAQRTRVVHNLVDGNATGVLISGNRRTASSHNVVLSNILSNSGRNNVAATWRGPVGRGNVVSANCLWHGFGGNVHAPGVRLAGNVVTSPRYVNRPADYTVQAAACIAKRPRLVGARFQALPAFRVVYHVRALRRRVQIVSLSLAGVAPGARLTVRCVRGCSARWSTRTLASTVRLPVLSGRWLPVGSAIDIRTTAHARAGAWARISVTGLPKGVSIAHGCLAPGGSTPVSCGAFG